MVAVVNKMYSTIGGDVPYSFNVDISSCNDPVVKYGKTNIQTYTVDWLSDLLEADHLGKSLYVTCEKDADSLGTNGGVPYVDENGCLIKQRGIGVLKEYISYSYIGGLIIFPFREWNKEKNMYVSYLNRQLNVNLSFMNSQNNRDRLGFGVLTHCSKNDTYYCHSISQSGSSGYQPKYVYVYNNTTQLYSSISQIPYADSIGPHNIPYGFYPEYMDKVWLFIQFGNDGAGSFTEDQAGNRIYTQDPYTWTLSDFSFNLTKFLYNPYALYLGNPFYPYPFDE